MSAALQSQAAAEAKFSGFVKRSFAHPLPLPSDVSLDDHVAVITGSNAGIGFEAARHMLRAGLSHLIMAVRSQQRGDAAAARLRAEFPKAIVSVWILDMDSYESVRAFAKRCADLPRLDMAILNAGIMNPSFQLSASGHESTMQVNYYSTALLAILLLKVLASEKNRRVKRYTQTPVLTVVHSDTAYWAKLNTTEPVVGMFDDTEKFAQPGIYETSKLLITIFVKMLASMVDPDKVLVHLVNPGMTKGTAFFDSSSLPVRMVLNLIQAMFARRADVAATTLVDAVVARGPESHGSFLSEWVIKPWPAMCYTEKGRDYEQKLWTETMEELSFAGVQEILHDLKH